MENTEYLLQQRWLQLSSVEEPHPNYGPWYDILRAPLNLDGLKQVYARMDDISGGKDYEEVQHLFQIVIVPRAVRMPHVQASSETSVPGREDSD